MSALPPESGHAQRTSSCLFWAISGHLRHAATRLLDYVSNFLLWTDKYDLIFSNEEFIRFYFRHFLHYKGRKVVQSDIGWHFVANPNFFFAEDLLDIHVLDIFFDDVALLCRELNGSRRNHSPVCRWYLSNSGLGQ